MISACFLPAGGGVNTSFSNEIYNNENLEPQTSTTILCTSIIFFTEALRATSTYVFTYDTL